ncbi:GNAT family N-acetyltransferase [Kordia sp.]|uniref:GNAT family N-acetyltransferase n=1 Tax=Kordia sp. TaxID=1965332 RepID=UPI003D2B8D65
MELYKLDWDSNFFGYEIAKCVVSNKENFEVPLFHKLAENFKLIYVFSEAPLATETLKLVDEKIVYHQEIKQQQTTKIPEIKVFDKAQHSYDQLVNLAYASGIHSRFRTDEEFKNDEFRKLYKKWIDNSISQKEKHEVLIYEKHNELLGLITYNIDNQQNSTIGLLAVHSNARGLGVASKLIADAMLRISEQGIPSVEVATQLNNIPANALYKKCGFTKKYINYIYHYWNI